MDRIPVSGTVPSTATDLSSLQKSVPTRAVGQGGATDSAASSRAGQSQASSGVPAAVEDALFALEKHLPIQILQNPRLLKAEWAWKLLILQQLADANVTLRTGQNAAQSYTATDSSSAQNEMGNGGHPQGESAATTASSAQSSTSNVGEPFGNGTRGAQPPLTPSGSDGSLTSGSAGSSSVLQSNQAQTQTEQTAPVATTLTSTSQTSERSTEMTQSAEAFSQTQGTGAEATSQMPVQTEAAVRQLWGLLSAIAPSVGKEAKQVQLNFRPSATLVPFSALGEEAIQQGNRPSDTSKLVQWVVQDRLSAAIVENPYERLGGGLYYPETQGERTNQPPHVAVKWEAHRQTRIGAAGKLIHRLRFDLEVQGQPVTCIVTAQRPQLLVHFATDHVPLLTHLRRGEHMVTAPLAATGWELVSWTAGLASQEGEGSEWQPNEQ